MRVLFEHGMDPQIGNKVLGPIEDLGEDKRGAYYTVPLLDTSYNRDLAPGRIEAVATETKSPPSVHGTLMAGVIGVMFTQSSEFQTNLASRSDDHPSSKSDTGTT